MGTLSKAADYSNSHSNLTHFIAVHRVEDLISQVEIATRSMATAQLPGLKLGNNWYMIWKDYVANNLPFNLFEYSATIAMS